MVRSVRLALIHLLAIASIVLVMGSSFASLALSQQPRGPSDVVREFYKAMREHRFREAFALTNYKSAVESLTAEDMQELEPNFEDKAKAIPETVEITAEQINGNSAVVFVRNTLGESSPQVTSQPLNLMNSGGAWIIVFGSEADQQEVKKAGRRFLLDAMLAEHESDAEDFLNRLMVWEGIYSQQRNSGFTDFAALIQAGMFSTDVIDPRLSGYNFHITVAKDGKSYVATAEPVRHGHTGKLSFWSDQTGAVKSADTGGKPLKH